MGFAYDSGGPAVASKTFNYNTYAFQNQVGVSYFTMTANGVNVLRNLGVGSLADSSTGVLAQFKTNHAGPVLSRVANDSTAAGAASRYDLVVAGTNTYGILALERGDGTDGYMSIAVGEGVTNGIRYQAPFHSLRSVLGDEFLYVDGTGLHLRRRAYTVPELPAFSTTLDLDCSKSNVFEVDTLTANFTLTLSNPTPGQAISIRFQQDSTGNRTVTLPAGSKVDGSLSGFSTRVSWLFLVYSSRASRWEGNWMLVPV